MWKGEHSSLPPHLPAAAQGNAPPSATAKLAHTGQWSLPCCCGQMSAAATHTAGEALLYGPPLLVPPLGSAHCCPWPPSAAAARVAAAPPAASPAARPATPAAPPAAAPAAPAGWPAGGPPTLRPPARMRSILLPQLCTLHVSGGQRSSSFRASPSDECSRLQANTGPRPY